MSTTKRGLNKFFEKCSAEIQKYFASLPLLIKNDFGYDVILAYVFFRIEQGQNMTLYCGARKIHRTNSELTWKAINTAHITRDKYKQLFKSIFGFSVDNNTQAKLENAEKVRDKLMHGKAVKDSEMRSAIEMAISYAEGINSLISSKSNIRFKPYNPDLRGIFGRLSPLEKSTSKLVLKGIGFDLR